MVWLKYARRLWPTLLMLTRDETPEMQYAAASLQQGSGGIVLRAYNLGPEARLALGRDLSRLCRVRRLLFLVAVRDNTDLAMAARIRADGLHMPEWVARQQSIAPVIGWCRRYRRILTVAAHGPQGLARGQQLGADAALLSPVFHTVTHIKTRPIGPVRFAALCRTVPLPVIALGGVRSYNVRRLLYSKAIGVAIGQPTLSGK
ncbi:Mutator mutT protein (7,8-dihydro-8-oxoguanine-triphosphatase) / Thiamin-phosphate pyrophosphorylase-like protein [invertebrate metagenome]|uniref:Mutator mutT protein (7,8-dihydro-8-oxoguanine-triphosphatase) / Thiamin-phosphate pyrophosphorylase-like protein n=1 Tax=invertebrate metagenome TaxID=1711999 RepID=A0A484H8E0_9ZZZZ